MERIAPFRTPEREKYEEHFARKGFLVLLLDRVMRSNRLADLLVWCDRTMMPTMKRPFRMALLSMLASSAPEDLVYKSLSVYLDMTGGLFKDKRVFGEYLLNLQMHRSAARFYRDIIYIKQRSLYAHVGLAKAAIAMMDFDEAKRVLDAASAFYPKNDQLEMLRHSVDEFKRIPTQALDQYMRLYEQTSV